MLLTPNGIERPFLAGSISGVVIRPIARHTDQRGWLAELFRQDELPEEHWPSMAYVSETLPGVTRGPHEHACQTDLFVFMGPGDFEVRLWDNRPASPTYWHTAKHVLGQLNPCVLIVPPGVVHGYRNISDVPGWTFNAPNRLFAGHGRRSHVDEIRHEGRPGSPFCFEPS